MQKLKLPLAVVQSLIVVVLVLGVFFRFVNIEHKVYWHDETYTSLRISGYTSAEMAQQLDGRLIDAKDFAKFQSPNPEKGLTDTLKSLALEDPQHPPLYYVMARFWVQCFGSSVRAIRSLSAIISLLVFPCVYWLCQELFESPLIGWVAIALMAVSPIHILYAQEAREYILWAVTILLSSASLLRAISLQDRGALGNRLYWAIYTVTLALSLYTFLLSGLVALAHGIYVIATQRCRWTKTFSAYFLALLAGILLFVPWIAVVVTNFHQFQLTTGWTMMKVPALNLIQGWLLHVSRIFFDFDFGFENNLSYLITPTFLILVSYAFYFIDRQNLKKAWLFILTLTSVPALCLILPDLILGGLRSASGRYLIPSYLGIQLAVAYLLATQLSSASFLRRKMWQAIASVLIVSGIVSCAVSSQAETWWIKVISYHNPQVARIINQADSPILMSSFFGSNPGNVVSLSYLLKPKVRFQLVREPHIPRIPDEFSDIFILNPFDKLQDQLKKEQISKINWVYGDDHILLFKASKT